MKPAKIISWVKTYWPFRKRGEFDCFNEDLRDLERQYWQTVYKSNPEPETHEVYINHFNTGQALLELFTNEIRIDDVALNLAAEQFVKRIRQVDHKHLKDAKRALQGYDMGKSKWK